MSQGDQIIPMFDYTMFYRAGVTYIQDCYLGTYPVVDTSGQPENALNTFMGLHAAGVFRMRVDKSVQGGNGITISITNATAILFWGGGASLNTGTAPLLGKILIGGSTQATNINDITFDGIEIDSCQLQANTGFNISYIDFHNCPGTINGTTKTGYLIDNSLGGYSQYIYWTGRPFFLNLTSSGNTGYVITFNGTNTNANHFIFDPTTVVASGGGTTGFMSTTASGFTCEEVQVVRLDYNKSGSGADTIVNIAACSTSGVTSTVHTIDVQHLYYEQHGTSHTVCVIGAYTSTAVLQFYFVTEFAMIAEVGNTHTWLTNSNANFTGSHASAFEVMNGIDKGGSNLILGTWAESTSFHVYLYSVSGTTVSKNNPFGAITNWLGTGTNNSTGYITPNGDSSTVVASTTYTMGGCPGYLSWSGGTGLSATIKDNNGNTLLSAQATGVRVRLEPGYTVNFGAYTGSPTFTADFQ